MMKTTLKWKSDEKDKTRQEVRVEHQQYCGGEYPKHLVLQFGDDVVEIHTGESGLKQISDAIANHPHQMKAIAKKKYEEAISEARKLGFNLLEQPAKEDDDYGEKE